MNQSAPSAEPPPPTPQRSYGRVVLRGMAWTTVAVTLGRITGLLTNLVLGYLLAPADYGVFAVAIGVSVIALTLRSSGMQKLLIQRGDKYGELAQPFARLTFVIYTAAMLMLGFSGPWCARYFDSPAMVPLLWTVGLSMPLAVPAEILRSKLAIDMRFRAFAFTNVVTGTLAQALMIAFAVAGFGPFSFALPMPIVAAVESLGLLWFVGLWPKGRPIDWGFARETFIAAKWIVLCGLAAAFVVHGSSLVVGRLESQVVTGFFYFGFQLTASVALFFNTSMQRVMLPALSRLSSEPRRQGDAYIKAVRVLAILTAPVCCLGVVIAAPVIRLLWSGKWDPSVQVFQPLTTVIPVYMMSAIGAALLEARGLWRANALLHVVSGAGTLAAAWIGASLGGLWEIALAAATFRCAFGIMHGLCMTKLLNRKPHEFLRGALPPCVICGVVAWVVVGSLGDRLAGHSPLLQIVVQSFGYVVVVGVAYGLLLRRRLSEIGQILQMLRGANSGSVSLPQNETTSS